MRLQKTFSEVKEGMNESTITTREPSQNPFHSRVETFHKAQSDSLDVFLPIQRIADTNPEKLIAATKNRSVVKSSNFKTETFTVHELKGAKNVYGVVLQPPPLWKQKKLIIAMLCNLAVIIAIHTVIFIILRG